MQDKGRKPYLVRATVTTVTEVTVSSHPGEVEQDARELQACGAFDVFPRTTAVQIEVVREATPEDMERTRPPVRIE